ncbi:hypothetical protein BC830DRAFT_271088 [Chytriomyces sp. MP71]|nr:hypothetical protein BC830DRAFT_271088 [Chytriomyces sp. MP71]
METGESAGANGRAWQEGDENTTASTDTERRGSQDLVAAPSTSFAVSKNQENWKRICEALRSLIDKHGFDPRFVVDAEGVLGNLAVFQQKGIALDFHMGEALDVENSWILGEVLHHDEKLGRLLAKAGGVPDHIVEEEVLYWMLVDTKIQVPLKRHSPLLPAEELYMRQQVAKLPSPIPVPTLPRLVEYTATPAIQLRDIADDLIASLVSPANLAANRKPEAALHRVDTLVDAFGVQPFELLAHFVIPGWENFVDGDNVATAGPAVVAKAAGAVDSDEFEDLFSAYASSRVQLLTKIGAESGVVPWSYWNYLVVRYTSPSTVLRESWKGTPVARTVVSILVHDLAVRRAAAGDDRDEAKRWFSEKEADKALAALLKSVRASGVPVEVFKGTVMEVGRRILEAVQNGCVGLAVVPERFVAVMEVVEGIVLTAAGPRQVGENVEEVKHLEMEQVEPVPVPVQVTGSTPSLVRLWVQILNIIFLENPDWQALVDESSTTEEILDDTPVPIHIKFYWAVASLVEDALNVHTGAHAKFRNWVTELEAVAASAPVGVASKKEGSATTLSGLTSSLFYRVAEFGSVLAHSKAAESVGNVGSKIASSSVVTGTTAVIGKRIANSGVVETVGHAGATVTAGISSIASTLQKTLGHKDSVAELKAKEEVLAAAGAGAVKPVSLIGTEKESEKQARDAAWDRLSSRLSTAKKE